MYLKCPTFEYYFSIEGILVMNGPFFDLCAMSKFVHYAKYSHDPIGAERQRRKRKEHALS